MRQKIILDLKTIFTDHSFTEITPDDKLLFVYETAGIDAAGFAKIFTVMTNVATETQNFEIVNKTAKNFITHICIDGDFITSGQWKYGNSSSKTDGRPDCIVFDDTTFLFVELKLNQEDATFGKEDTKWKKLLEGANQILCFVDFLRGNNFEIKNYYSKVYGLVSMRFEPNFSLKGTTARNTEIFKISQKLGFKIIAQNYFEF